MQRGKQLAERAQSTSKLLREDISRGQRKGLNADGSPFDAAQDPSGVAGLTKRLEDYATAFEQISAATGARSILLMQADPETSQCGRCSLRAVQGAALLGGSCLLVWWVSMSMLLTCAGRR